MAQRRADAADPALWRRAVAREAAPELGVGFSEALSHPLVARAQELAGHASVARRRADALTLAAVHLRGVAGLSPSTAGLTVGLGPAGLDIIEGDHLVARVPWGEIAAIEVPAPRQRRLRRRDAPEAELVVRTSRGVAAFQIPGLTPEQLHARLEPVVERHTGD
jgi:hypothetical protein